MVEWAMSEVIRNLCQRVPSATPIDPSHAPSQGQCDVKLDSYDIPKGSNLVRNLASRVKTREYLGNHTLSEALEWPFKFRPKWLKEENIDIKGHDFRVLPFEVGWRFCPEHKLGINLALLDGVGLGNVGMEKNSGIVTFMRTPLLAVAVSRLLSHLYKHVLVDL
uniref:Uncharacterized protein n=1 Tax=Ananas comosus var. bracteatus TaxID=296719 RepID=A0A6V7NFA5_ANACO|nr:unnamed protein product [Ananas comosus var. bracteatus]